LRILLRLRRPKATPREATSSFSFYLQGLDQRGHCDGFLLSANTKFVNPVFAPLEPATCDLMPTFISLFPFYILLNPVILSYSVRTTTGFHGGFEAETFRYDHYPIFATKRSTSLCTGSTGPNLTPLWVAREAGLHRHYGLDVDLVFFCDSTMALLP
jgi:hypothetical protein